MRRHVYLSTAEVSPGLMLVCGNCVCVCVINTHSVIVCATSTAAPDSLFHQDSPWSRGEDGDAVMMKPSSLTER